MIEHLSYSSITTYLGCPEAWRRKYIEKEPTFGNPSMFFGSVFHDTAERLSSGEDKSITEIWDESWKSSLEDPRRGNVFWGLDTPDVWYNEGLRMLSSKAVMDQIKSIHPTKDDAGPMIERKVELHVPGVEIPIVGYIDVVLEDGTPADIKTSSRSWTGDKASGSLQTLFYIAAMNQMGMPVNWNFTHLVFVTNKEPKVQTLTHSHKPAELFFLFEMVKRVWDSINKECFPINPTYMYCSPKSCDFYQNCRGRYG